MAKDDLTAQQVRELFYYNSATGEFVARTRAPHMFRSAAFAHAWNLRFAHKTAGGNSGNGYRHISIFGSKYYAHRLAWAITYGEWPALCLDHINGNKTDNRIANLRLASVELNNRNRRNIRKDSASGVMGVRKNRRKFIAYLCVNGRQVFLGSFKTTEEAHAAYLAGKDVHHPGWR